MKAKQIIAENNVKLERNNPSDLLEFVKILREEASELKECFNRQCFQVIAIISVLFVFLVRFMFTAGTNIGLAAYLSLILIITVINVGIYKFEGANRITGYILHLERQLSKPQKILFVKRNYFFVSSFVLNWEFLLKAWRIFHSTIDSEMYICWKGRGVKDFVFSPFDRIKCAVFKGKLKTKYEANDNYLWYLPSKLIHKDANYNPGNYLRRMMFMLHVLGGISMAIILVASVFGDYSHLPNSDLVPFLSLPHSLQAYKYNIVLTIINCVVFTVSLLYMYVRPRRFIVKLEEQINSIHSNSIMWEVVNVAHMRALEILDKEKPFRHYSFVISCLALDFIECGIDKPQQWCDPKRNLIIADFIKERICDFPKSVQQNIGQSLSNFAKLQEHY